MGVGEPARPISVLPLRTDSMTSSGREGGADIEP